jgi:hypothetical protein
MLDQGGKTQEFNIQDFLATAHPELRPVQPDEITISRTFWLLRAN